ncbi:hypothetical protein [Amnibacterium endophyticum]|uniref:Uncharacterized protein n=1 Tax=Amnibacterium endophyticum TaxID=2109337 RepID=A0ABW4LI68_9MICO
MSPTTGVEDAWALTRAISPRDRVRVAATTSSGEVLNQYSRTWLLDQIQPPAAPWAVPLASLDGFRLLAFDFDAKGDEAGAARDAAALSSLLVDAGIAHLICRSGPSGGRHVWAAASQALDVELVGTVARLAAAVLPTLDIAPLRNSATGCVRPPGAPHRDGGRSEILEGDLGCLLQPTTDSEALVRVARALAAQITGAAIEDDSPVSATVRVDERGHPYLPGVRRPLPAASLAALEAAAADLDASTVLNTVLLGAAASHWHMADVAELAGTAPGLEHLRSKRGTRGRTPRRPREQAETLARQWRYAVKFVAENPRRAGLDATFDTRAGDLADTVRTLQERADAAPGRWNSGGGPADRRVLDTLHLFALTAVNTIVEADIRRLALACGIGRETARTALHRLTADGWIRRAEAAAGVHGARWHVDPHRVLPSGAGQGRSQAATRPEGAGAAERTALTQQLQHRLTLATHDVFSGHHALPHAAGNLYARLAASPSPSTTTADEGLLHRLATFNLVHLATTGWRPADFARRDFVATELQVDGRLERRRRRYQVERAVWSWWQAEHAWMCGPRTRRDARARADQAPLWQPAGITRYPKHPRRSDGRADYTAARAAVHDGALTASVFLAA